MSRIAALLMVSLVAVGSAHAEGKDIDKVNGAIVASAGESYGKLETVNGAIRIAEGVDADSAETVNGRITVAAKARVGSMDAVNGSIRSEEHQSELQSLMRRYVDGFSVKTKRTTSTI